jgi:hypothetical protein
MKHRQSNLKIFCFIMMTVIIPASIHFFGQSLPSNQAAANSCKSYASDIADGDYYYIMSTITRYKFSYQFKPVAVKLDITDLSANVNDNFVTDKILSVSDNEIIKKVNLSKKDSILLSTVVSQTAYVNQGFSDSVASSLISLSDISISFGDSISQDSIMKYNVAFQEAGDTGMHSGPYSQSVSNLKDY